ncbi:MAG: ComF family protein [Candidatus Omnitrophica bacterium]|nr:ComF family protein [Candidatus Omnitrophota bacterium]
MLKKYIKTAKNLLFPLTCFSCEKKIHQGQLCNDCYKKIKFLKPPLCRYCLRKIDEPEKLTCNKCKTKLYPYMRAISATEYKEPLTKLIQLFKYRNCDYLGDLLAQLIIKHLEDIQFSAYRYHCITAVPLHRYKLKMRGYNQAEVLANFLSNHFNIPLRNDIISVTRFRPSQTKLARLKRQNNVKGIFNASNAVKNLNLILVDDIFTTGSTIFACSEALKEKGANIITALTLSKTVRNQFKQQS